MSSEVKVCRVCGCVLVVGMNILQSQIMKHDYMCKSCRSVYQRSYQQSHHKPRQQPDPKKLEKLQPPMCKKCGAVLVEGENWYSSFKKNGFHSCKDCTKKYRAQKSESRKNNMDVHHNCKFCGELLIIGENYTANRYGNYQYFCNNCRRENAATWQKKNPNYHLQYSRVWRENNREHLRERDRKYKNLHRDRVRRNERIRRHNNPEPFRLRHKHWVERNPDKVKMLRKKYYENNSDKLIIKRRKWYELNRDAILENRKLNSAQYAEYKRRMRSRNMTLKIESYIKYRQEREEMHRIEDAFSFLDSCISGEVEA
jgi:hypothetical protein